MNQIGYRNSFVEKYGNASAVAADKFDDAGEFPARDDDGDGIALLQFNDPTALICIQGLSRSSSIASSPGKLRSTRSHFELLLLAI